MSTSNDSPTPMQTILQGSVVQQLDVIGLGALTDNWENFEALLLATYEGLSQTLGNQPDFEDLKPYLDGAHTAAVRQVYGQKEAGKEFLLKKATEILNYSYDDKVKKAILKSTELNPILYDF